MKIDKARADLAEINEAAEAAILQAADLAAKADEQERLAGALQQKALLLASFISEYGDSELDAAPSGQADGPPWEAPARGPAAAKAAKREAKSNGKPPRVRTKMTPEILEAILSQTASGATAAVVAKNLGLSTATVYNYTREHKRAVSNSEDKAPEGGAHAGDLLG